MSSRISVSPRVGALLAALAALFVVAGTAGPAAAEDGYRYWNYSHLTDGAWEFAQTGPGDYTPKDGDVEGWRYGTSTVSQGIAPRADLDEVTFEAVCESSEEAADGEKRVAVLIDYGTAADAAGTEVPEPHAECAVVPAKATGQQVLESVAEVRTKKSSICAVDGYPAKGCFETIPDADVSAEQQTVAFAMPASADAGAGAGSDTEAAAAADTAEDGGSDTWLLIGVGVLVVAGAALAVPLYRRNRDA